jgi:hypothetical protein
VLSFVIGSFSDDGYFILFCNFVVGIETSVVGIPSHSQMKVQQLFIDSFGVFSSEGDVFYFQGRIIRLLLEIVCVLLLSKYSLHNINKNLRHQV